MKKIYDVVVIGGGMVGSALAVSLAKSSFQVMLVDILPCHFPSNNNNTAPDLRVSAISYVSVDLLHKIHVWRHINELFCVPYSRIETWEWQASKVIFDAKSINLPILGFIVENNRLLHGLWQEMANCQALTLRCPAKLKKMQYDNRYWQLQLNDGSEVISRLLVGADGANSQIRKNAGIPISGWQYRQSCLLLSVKTKNANSKKDTTWPWQMLTPTGPRAFLPLYDQWASLVWYDTTQSILQLQKLPINILEQQVLANFPQRLGSIKLYQTSSFLLTRSHAYNYVKPGLALIGDAAHTINPLAGQGANLGFKDVIALSEILISARDQGEEWNTLLVLERYQQQRRRENLLMQNLVDLFYVIFSNNILSIKLIRNFSMLLAQCTDDLKKRILKYAIGL